MTRTGRQRTRELSARDGGFRTRADEGESRVLAERLAEAEPAGTPLEPLHRDVLESRLGHEFSHVRIHADAAADGLARDLGARAFAVGDEVFFRAGEFEPDTQAGL